MVLPILTIKPPAVKRVRTGHPWIFSNEIIRPPKGLDPGEPVDIKGRSGDWIGRGYFNPRTLIAARLFTRERVAIDDQFLEQKIEKAEIFRKKYYPEEEAYRLVFGEADGLPGLIVDRYGSVLVTQFLTAGMNRLTEKVVAVLVERFQPAAVVARNDSAARVLEGLPQEKRLLYGNLPSSVIIQKNGLVFEVDVLEGQKTGFFLDQSENYRLLNGMAAGGRVLDVFCYTGAWGLHAARYGAKTVRGLDSSDRAIQQARANSQRNGLDTICRFEQGDVFKALRSYHAAGDRFDVVILDPPAFAKSRQKVKDALRGYKEINRQAMRLLAPGGILVSCSCSYLVDGESFREVLAGAAADAGRSFWIVDWQTQARDHPIALGIPETQYLKCAVLQMR